MFFFSCMYVCMLKVHICASVYVFQWCPCQLTKKAVTVAAQRKTPTLTPPPHPKQRPPHLPLPAPILPPPRLFPWKCPALSPSLRSTHPAPTSPPLPLPPPSPPLAPVAWSWWVPVAHMVQTPCVVLGMPHLSSAHGASAVELHLQTASRREVCVRLTSDVYDQLMIRVSFTP